MRTLAIDVGRTKYSMALFDGAKAGRDWMIGRIESHADKWRLEYGFDRIGISFGGPVDFASQTIALSTHVGGWSNPPLRETLALRYGVPEVLESERRWPA